MGAQACLRPCHPCHDHQHQPGYALTQTYAVHDWRRITRRSHGSAHSASARLCRRRSRTIYFSVCKGIYLWPDRIENCSPNPQSRVLPCAVTKHGIFWPYRNRRADEQNQGWCGSHLGRLNLCRYAHDWSNHPYLHCAVLYVQPQLEAGDPSHDRYGSLCCDCHLYGTPSGFCLRIHQWRKCHIKYRCWRKSCRCPHRKGFRPWKIWNWKVSVP